MDLKYIKLNGDYFFAGIDIGSTTAKISIIDSTRKIIYSKYVRHNTKIQETVIALLLEAKSKLGNFRMKIKVTGSAGIGVSEKSDIPFIQEIIAASEVVKNLYPSVKTLIDIGGEDSKMIFFYDNKVPDIRMNGSCAGGTGAFIDQMASLLNVDVSDFDKLAKNYKQIYPIASRCGVFAKTDVQNLLSRKISKEDIAVSVFHAVAIQIMNTLARAHDIVPKVMFSGGPFTFLPELRKTFIRDLNLKDEDVIIPKNPELLPSIGAALSEKEGLIIKVDDLVNRINRSDKKINLDNRLDALFSSKKEYDEWIEKRISFKAPRIKIKDLENKKCFLGIDSGSTTTKILAIDENKQIIFSFYENSNGNPVEIVRKGLLEFKNQLDKENKTIEIYRTAVVGYGEDLIKAAFNIEDGMVETIAHFNAAKYFDENVSFILDIGGQDMKAIFVENGLINRIELNESCSAGCGSFVETFSHSLGYKVSDFADIACKAIAPSDLGTRCTVFMNSKVKQSLRENATVEDIAAGLSISVIKNALFKVLKLKDISELGNNIVVQGGAFRNASIHRAMEQLAGKKVICSDIPEQMGAFGAAIFALENNILNNDNVKIRKIEDLLEFNKFETKFIMCKGCENVCNISKFTFSNNNVFYSGNKCEKYFYNKGSKSKKGINLFEYKFNLLFDRDLKANKNPKATIGIPRVLNIYENFPFWNTLFNQCGINVEISDKSTMSLYERGLGTVMSDSICFPAKLAHGHIFNLSEKKIDRIFYPMILFEKNEYIETDNSFNCPLVSNYPDVIRSSINPETKFNIPFDSPTFNFNDKELLKKACFKYLKQFGIKKSVFEKAFEKSEEEQKIFKQKIKDEAQKVLEAAKINKRSVIVLSGRPYHIDSLINQKTPETLSDFGVDVLSEDSLPNCAKDDLSSLQIISQWAYTNRIYNSAQWTANRDSYYQFVQLNSFGCGPDAIVIDENTEILKAKGKSLTLIRVDEITSTGSIRLRLRSMIESVRMLDMKEKLKERKRINTPEFKNIDKKRKIIGPYFGEIYGDLMPALFKLAGYELINLPKPDKSSVQYGLKYANNEICFPATVVVGDVLKALDSDNYKKEDIAVAISQTGGQCRASSYLSLIKKAMISAGFDDIPVVSLGTFGKSINPQEGFTIEWKKILAVTFVAILYADSVAKMHYSTRVREKNKGDSEKTVDRCIKAIIPFVEKNEPGKIFNELQNAVNQFNNIEVKNGIFPEIGIVGEIYVKYNSFGHQFISDWLVEQGVEVIVPPLVDFFVQEFVNIEINKKANITNRAWSDIVVYFLEKKANRYIKRIELINSKFKFYRPFHSIRDIAEKASKILDLTAQFGEGWLIPAEISGFAEDNINNVISVQPFGCIANHIVSKGVEKRIKDRFSDMNLLFLDFDADTSEVNILNRLHFMLENLFTYYSD
ncbi:MAG: 2-hydroxyacyl-CoA dehydratase [Bacteroidales bacterium]|nr:2-hydroxyacyl-CoA dehydratase [Bacteroidales bacterium]